MADGNVNRAKTETMRTMKKFIIAAAAAAVLCCTLVFRVEGNFRPHVIEFILKLWLWSSNSKILIVLFIIMTVTLITKSGLLKNSRENDDILYAEYVRRNDLKAEPKYKAPELSSVESTQGNSDISTDEQVKYICWPQKEISTSKLRSRSVTTVDKSDYGSSTADESTNAYSSSLIVVEAPAAQADAKEDHITIDDELNRRVEDFIAKIKLQIREGK